ncbi:MAG: MATE family efflux transporter [Polyangiales bacterium]
MALPAIAQQLLHTLVFLVDRAMLGRYGAHALASMQINGPITWSVFSVLSAFAVGTVALVGRAVGAGDRQLASAATRASLMYAIGAGLLVAGAGLAGLGGILALFPEAGPQVHEAARSYLVIVLPAMPLYLLSFTSASALQAAGDTRTPFVVAAAGNVLNVTLNWALIFGHWGAPRLGVAGAAVASASAMALQGLVLAGLLSGRRRRVSWRGRGGEWAALARMARVATAAVGERIVQHAGYLGYVAMIGVLGSMAMAANQALLSIEAVAFLSADGFGIAAAAVVAQRLGGGEPAEAARGARVATGLGIALLSACGLAFVLVPRLLLGAFSDDADIVAMGVPCMYVAAAAQPFMATAVVLSEAMRGAGATRTALVVTLIGGLAVRLGVTAICAFSLGWGLVGVWVGSTVDWVVRAVLLVAVFVRGRWREARV